MLGLTLTFVGLFCSPHLGLTLTLVGLFCSPHLGLTLTLVGLFCSPRLGFVSFLHRGTTERFDGRVWIFFVNKTHPELLSDLRMPYALPWTNWVPGDSCMDPPMICPTRQQWTWKTKVPCERAWPMAQHSGVSWTKWMYSFRPGMLYCSKETLEYHPAPLESTPDSYTRNTDRCSDTGLPVLDWEKSFSSSPWCVTQPPLAFADSLTDEDWLLERLDVLHRSESSSTPSSIEKVTAPRPTDAPEDFLRLDDIPDFLPVSTMSCRQQGLLEDSSSSPCSTALLSCPPSFILPYWHRFVSARASLEAWVIAWSAMELGRRPPLSVNG